MTPREVGVAFCQLMDQVNDRVFGYRHAADCFCGEESHPNSNYQNDGMCFEFIKEAVMEKIANQEQDVHGRFLREQFNRK